MKNDAARIAADAILQAFEEGHSLEKVLEIVADDRTAPDNLVRDAEMAGEAII